MSETADHRQPDKSPGDSRSTASLSVLILIAVGAIWLAYVSLHQQDYPQYRDNYYILLWVCAAALASLSATRLEGANLIAPLYGSDVTGRIFIFIAVLLSSFAFIVGFADYYLYLSVVEKGDAFGKTLSPNEAVYFSIVTFATVGFGDIVPKTDSARIAVSAQIILSMIYAISVFSLAATFVALLVSKNR